MYILPPSPVQDNPANHPPTEPSPTDSVGVVHEIGLGAETLAQLTYIHHMKNHTRDEKE